MLNIWHSEVSSQCMSRHVKSDVCVHTFSGLRARQPVLHYLFFTCDYTSLVSKRFNVQFLFLFCASRRYDAQRNLLAVGFSLCCVCVGADRNVGVMKISPDPCEVSRREALWSLNQLLFWANLLSFLVVCFIVFTLRDLLSYSLGCVKHERGYINKVYYY